jgi:hypothetical protein
LNKKRLIVIVTFLAGLYYFLEFVVPGIVPGTAVKGPVKRIDWGRVTYRLYDGTWTTHVDKPVLGGNKIRPEAPEIKRRNVLDEMAITDLSMLRPGDVIAVGSEADNEGTTGYGEHPEITIGPKTGKPTVSIGPDRRVAIGGADVAISSTRPLKIERGQARIWNAIRWRSAAVKPGDAIRGTWYTDMEVDFAEVVIITPDRVLLLPPGNGHEQPRRFAKLTPDDTLILGRPAATDRRATRLGLVTIHNGVATTASGKRYRLAEHPITITPPRHEGENAPVRIGGTQLSLKPKEGLYKLTRYTHAISRREHIEISTDSISISQRGVVGKVVPTVVSVASKRGVRSQAIVSRELIIRHTIVPSMIGGRSFMQPREGEAKATELTVGDNVEIGQTTYLTRWLAPVGDYLMVVVTFGGGLGMFNLLLLHGGIIRRRKGSRSFSIILIVAMFAMLVFTGFRSMPETTIENGIFRVMFYNMLMPLGNTTFSLLAFYLASASYRAFKIKTAEAALMSISAVIVMMGQVPIGIWLTHWDWVPPCLRLQNVCAWVLNVGHSSAYRAILLGAMVGFLAMALRLWLNLERGAFFDQEL